MGAKPKPVIDLAEVERLAGQGLTQLQICHCIGISEATLYKYKRNVKEFAQAIEQGRSKAIREVTNAMFNKAVEGDVGAGKYWLNNMARDQWRDKHDVEHTGEFTQTITVVDAGCGHVGPDADDQS